MKKLVILLVLFLVIPFTLTAQKKSIQSFLSYTTYCVPGDKPFIENALAFDCSSVVYNQFEPGKFKATVEIQTIFKQGDKICNYSKIALDSPVLTDTAKVAGAFIDQQRFSLDNGEYTMEVTIKDLNNPNQIPFKAEQTIVMEFPANQPNVSDILWWRAIKRPPRTQS